VSKKVGIGFTVMVISEALWWIYFIGWKNYVQLYLIGIIGVLGFLIVVSLIKRHLKKNKIEINEL